MKVYDLIIIGGGPAGLNAALYASRYGLKTLVITKEPGGLLATASYVENYLGFKRITGLELSQKFLEHAQEYGAKIVYDEVMNVKKIKSGFEVRARQSKHVCKKLLLAIGMSRRKLNIPGEERYAGRGVSYCATCDAAFFKNKIVGVVGGGNAAATSALLLSEYAKKVYLLYRRTKQEMKAEKRWVNLIDKNEKITIIPKVMVTELMGNKVLRSVKLSNGEELRVDGLFIEVGSVPRLNLIKELGLKTDEQGYVVVNKSQETSVKGVYAAGDITTNSNKLRQVCAAVSEGAIAARSIYEKLMKEEVKS